MSKSRPYCYKLFEANIKLTLFVLEKNTMNCKDCKIIPCLCLCKYFFKKTIKPSCYDKYLPLFAFFDTLKLHLNPCTVANFVNCLINPK